MHYVGFHTVPFDTLKSLFQEEMDESKEKRKESYMNDREVRDFVPFKAAIRIR
jgi:hypothetical protein